MKAIKKNEDEVGLESSNALNFNPGIQWKCGYLVCRSRRSRMGEICTTKDFVTKYIYKHNITQQGICLPTNLFDNGTTDKMLSL
jgi:hypothetical protein